MSLTATFKETDGAQSSFGVGDLIKVHQRVTEQGKSRLAIFDGIVIKIKGRDVNKSFTVRKIGLAKIGIERIFQLFNPTIEKIEIVKSGHQGVKHAKLYYIRTKSKKEIDKIFGRASKKVSKK